MKKILSIIVVILLMLIGLVTYVYLNLNSIVKKGIETVGPDITKTSVSLKKVSISLFSGDGTLHDFIIGNPKGFSTPYLLRVGEFYLKLKPMTVFKDLIVVDKIFIESPKIIVEFKGKQNNLQVFKENIMPSETQKDSTAGNKPKKQSKEKKVLIKELILKRPQIEVTMPDLGIGKKQIIIDEIRLTNLGGEKQSTKDIVAQITKAIMDKVLPAALPALDDLKRGLKDLQNKAKASLEELKQGNIEKAKQGLEDLKKGTFNKENLDKNVQDIKKGLKGLLPKN